MIDDLRLTRILSPGAQIAKRKTLDFVIFQDFGYRRCMNLPVRKNLPHTVPQWVADTPLFWAEQMGHKDVADLLRQNGGHQ